MAAHLFAELADEQLRCLRQLVAAGLSAVPGLAVGEALTVSAELEREHQRRAPTTLSIDIPAGVPTLAPGALAGALTEAAIGVRSEATSTTKWSAVTVLLARALGLPESTVYVTSVGGLSRNIAVRLIQSRRARSASVAAVIWTPDTEPLRHAVNAAARACQDTPRLTLVFVLDGEDLQLAAIVLPSTLPAPPALRLAYPAAAVVAADQQRPNA